MSTSWEGTFNFEKVKNNSTQVFATTKKSEKNCPEDFILNQPYNYICSLPGKGIRSKLLASFNLWLEVEKDVVVQVAEIMEMLHNASLLLDDIEDNSDLRRGKPAAHIIFGVPHTINTANYIIFAKALQKVLALNHPKAFEIFTEEISWLIHGQGMEIFWRDNFVCPTESQFKDTVVKKTTGLFMLGIRLLQLFSKNENNFRPLVSNLGLYFQIRDDYANIMLTEYTDSKSFCEDVTEGKFSFPVIHAIRSFPQDDKIQQILKQRTRDLEVKKHFVSLLKERGSIKYTAGALKEIEKEIRKEIMDFGGNPSLSKVVDLLTISMEE